MSGRTENIVTRAGLEATPRGLRGVTWRPPRLSPSLVYCGGAARFAGVCPAFLGEVLYSRTIDVLFYTLSAYRGSSPCPAANLSQRSSHRASVAATPGSVGPRYWKASSALSPSGISL